jgi:hypothetical protein
MDYVTLRIGLDSMKFRGFERFKRNTRGVHLWLHRSFTFDAQENGYPKTILYANGNTGRFDWCKIIDDEGNISTIQIGALLVLEDNGEKSMIWIGFKTSTVVNNLPAPSKKNKKKGNKKKTSSVKSAFSGLAFPGLKYSLLPRTGQFEIKTGFVDEIYQPAMVVAMNLDPRSFFVKNFELRKTVLHKHVDLL